MELLLTPNGPIRRRWDVLKNNVILILDIFELFLSPIWNGIHIICIQLKPVLFSSIFHPDFNNIYNREITVHLNTILTVFFAQKCITFALDYLIRYSSFSLVASSTWKMWFGGYQTLSVSLMSANILWYTGMIPK